MPLRAVLLDAVGTLIHADPPVATAYADAARACDVLASDAEIRSRFEEAFAAQEQIDQQFGHATSPSREQSRWRQIVDHVFREAVPASQTRERVFAALWNHFASSESWRVYGDAAECLESLRARGLIVGVASNFDDRLVQIARRLDPLARVGRLFISAQIGHRKPAAEFFRFIERELQLAPAELLSVGDDFENDVAGAKAAGWQAIWLNRHGSEARAADVILSLEELPSRL